MRYGVAGVWCCEGVAYELVLMFYCGAVCDGAVEGSCCVGHVVLCYACVGVPVVLTMVLSRVLSCCVEVMIAVVVVV